MMNKEACITGGCQCGTIRYRVMSAPIVVYLCHCSDCQRQTSSAFGMSVWFDRQSFSLQTGKLSFWSAITDRGNSKLCAFCPNCGSRIYHAADHQSEIISVKGGSLDEAKNLNPVAHIWCKSAQAWAKAAVFDAAGMRCYQAEPDSFKQIVELYNARKRDNESKCDPPQVHQDKP